MGKAGGALTSAKIAKTLFSIPLEHPQSYFNQKIGARGGVLLATIGNVMALHMWKAVPGTNQVSQLVLIRVKSLLSARP